MPDEPPIETAEQAAAYDAWFRAKVEASLASREPVIPHEDVMASLRAIIDHHRTAETEAVSMAEMGRRIAARRAELGITDADIPRNAGTRRTQSKKALLKAIRDAGGTW